MDTPDPLNDQLTNIADAIPVGDAALSLVEVRDTVRQRRRRRSALGGVLAATVLVGGIVVVGALTGDSGSDTIAIDGSSGQAPANTDAPVESAAGGDGQDDDAPAATAPDGEAATASSGRQFERIDVTPTAISIGGGDAGDVDSYVEWIVPWQEGFLAGRTNYVPRPLPTVLPDEVSALFPQEVLDLFADGLPSTLNEATEMLSEAGLLDEVTDVLAAHPEASEAIYSADVPEPTVEVVFSSDGTTWEPIEMVVPDGLYGLYGVQSTGTRLAVAAQIQDEQAISDGSTYPDQVGRIIVATTTDLVNWDITDVDAGARPADLPDVYQFGASPGTLAVNGSGWVLGVQTYSDVNIDSLLPDDVRERLNSSRGGAGTSTDETGVIIEIYDDGPVATDSASDEGDVVFGEPVITETLRFSWEELGVDPAVLDQINGGGDQTVYAASWDSAPVEVDGVTAWSIVGTASGFYAVGGDSLDYSADGVSWTSLALPAGQVGVGSVKSLDGDALVFTQDDENATSVFQVSGARGEWERLDHPDLPAAMNNVFGNDNSTPAMIVDGSEPVVPEPTEITVEADGFIMVMREQQSEVSVLVTDSSGAVVADETVDWRSGDEPSTWRYANSGVQILDEETGATIVTFGNSVMEAAYREQTDRYDQFDEYDPDLWLVATTDGDRWLIEDLEVSLNDANFGPGAMALNGTTLLVDIGDGWQRYDLS